MHNQSHVFAKSVRSSNNCLLRVYFLIFLYKNVYFIFHTYFFLFPRYKILNLISRKLIFHNLLRTSGLKINVVEKKIPRLPRTKTIHEQTAMSLINRVTDVRSKSHQTLRAPGG